MLVSVDVVQVNVTRYHPEPMLEIVALGAVNVPAVVAADAIVPVFALKYAWTLFPAVTVSRSIKRKELNSAALTKTDTVYVVADAAFVNVCITDALPDVMVFPRINLSAVVVAAGDDATLVETLAVPVIVQVVAKSSDCKQRFVLDSSTKKP
jgi:hypothetical protein